VPDVEDIGSRRVVGFALVRHLCTELVSSALDTAFAIRGEVVGAVFHNDPGVLGSSCRVEL
jgi:hypothetical protein